MYWCLWFIAIIIVSALLYVFVRVCQTRRTGTIVAQAKGQVIKQIPIEDVIQRRQLNLQEMQYNIRLHTQISTVIPAVKNQQGAMIDRVLVINLDESSDRLLRMRPMLERFFSEQIPVHRLHALRRKSGALGCLLSHVAALCHGIQDENLLILEDDFEFVVSPEQLNIRLKEVRESFDDRWDVVVFGQYCTDWARVSGTSHLMRLFHNTTTSGYLINHKYIPTLLQLWTQHAAKVTGKKQLSHLENCDQVWTSLQENDTWLGFTQPLGQQTVSKSVILNKNVDNRWHSLPGLRRFRGWAGKIYNMNLRDPVRP